MGVCLTSRKSSYSFNMGYGGFNNLRANIARAFDKELGEAYSDIVQLITNPKEYNERINKILVNDRFKDEDEDILDFLFASDCEGKCGYKTAKKIYTIIKDYEYLKDFLKECCQKRRTIIWY